MTTCPYCKEKFEDSYYFRWHVPCPEPTGDRQEEAKSKKK